MLEGLEMEILLSARITRLAVLAVFLLASCTRVAPTEPDTAVILPEPEIFHTGRCGQYTVSMSGVRQISLEKLAQRRTESGDHKTGDFLIALEASSTEGIQSVEYKIVDLKHFGSVEAVRVTSQGKREAFIGDPSDVSVSAVAEDVWSQAAYDKDRKAFILETWLLDRFFAAVTLVPGTYHWRERPVGTVRINGGEECEFRMGVYEFTITS